MMKTTLIAFVLFLISSSASAQYFNIFPGIIDSTENNDIYYRVTGVANLSDSVVFHADLVEETELLTVVSSRIYFTGDSLASDSAFTYNPETQLFSVDFGTFPERNLMLHMWVTLGDVIYNEVYYKD